MLVSMCLLRFIYSCRWSCGTASSAGPHPVTVRLMPRKRPQPILIEDLVLDRVIDRDPAIRGERGGRLSMLKVTTSKEVRIASVPKSVGETSRR